MSIILDHQLREKMAHDASAFPISYFQDELALLPNQVGPLHWHPEFEIATAASGVLVYQVGQERITLEPGDSILVGGNMLHSIRQLSGDVPDPMPNIVFFGSLIAPENSTIHAQYIQPIIDDHALPYVVFRHDSSGHEPVNALIRHRLQKAHGMLHDTTRTLQEISQACGFNSVNYFSRQFRKHYGYAPSRANERLK